MLSYEDRKIIYFKCVYKKSFQIFQGHQRRLPLTLGGHTFIFFSRLKYQNNWKLAININASGNYFPPWAPGG